MNFVTFLFLLLTFPFWAPVVGGLALGFCVLWWACYPIACTAHMLYVRARYGMWVRWNLIMPRQ